ncbi:MAG: tetratricopeptide repeat protein [Spirochaetes bacterium]|nr:tetratricopeptide repeat protein [Spirochaetota bacterium]
MSKKELLELVEVYTKGLELYRSRKFDQAIKQFQKALKIKPEDGPSKLYIQRCELLLKKPPAADWDGVFTMTTK